LNKAAAPKVQQLSSVVNNLSATSSTTYRRRTVKRATASSGIWEKHTERRPVQHTGFTDPAEQRIGITDRSLGDGQQILDRKNRIK